MEICSYKHEEICYASHSCPMCEMVEQLQQVKTDLEAEVENLKDQLSELGE